MYKLSLLLMCGRHPCTVEAVTEHSLTSLALVLDNTVQEHGLTT